MELVLDVAEGFGEVGAELDLLGHGREVGVGHGSELDEEAEEGMGGGTVLTPFALIGGTGTSTEVG